MLEFERHVAKHAAKGSEHGPLCLVGATNAGCCCRAHAVRSDGLRSQQQRLHGRPAAGGCRQ
eukprot:4668067-Prymnesium_polylepis.1